MDWTTCPSCEEEFKVVTDSLDRIQYCPFCAEDIDQPIDEDFDFEDE